MTASSSYETGGGFADIPSHAGRLARSPDDSGTLVIGVVDSEAFVQFAGGAGGIQMDFPIVTKGQRAWEPAFRRYLSQLGLAVQSRIETDGTEYLDVELPGDPHRVAQIARDVLIDVMEADPSAALTFMGEGVGDAR